MARASTKKKVKRSTPAGPVEECWILVGQRCGRIWFCRRVRHTTGERICVGFDGLWVLQREERHGDVLGFLHTHPDGPAGPSLRDLRTMRSWRSAFGKPLLCVIDTPLGLKGYRFDGDESEGEELKLIEAFPRGVVVGVDAGGRQVSS
ncbi:MAG: Mov34/MPN/PAD-1 family protein [Gemmataceae bacterium]|nr:Mov34/MPN/PAD-1 family protein [Gemmataceae bacterium]